MFPIAFIRGHLVWAGTIALTAFHAFPADRSVSEIVATAGPSVAVVTQFGRDGKQGGVGAGFAVSKDGLVATCLHVIGEGRPVRVVFPGKPELEVTEVYASDRKLDLAIVRVAATNLVPLRLGDSDALGQGANVVAIGNPLGLEHSVVSGVVSARREIQGNRMFQLAIPIESGNSGGPLLDMRGRVHGVLTLKHALAENLGFAMPVNALKKLLDQPNPMPMSTWRQVNSLDPAEWTPLMGAHWRRKSGAIHVEGAGSGFGGRSLCLSEQAPPDFPYEVAVTVRLEDESGAAGLAFGADGGERHFGFYPTAGQFRLTRFDGPNVLSWNILQEVRTTHYRTGEWNRIKVRVDSNAIIGFVNGQKVMEMAVEAPPRGKAGLAKFRNTTADFRGFAMGRRLEEAPGDAALALAVKRVAESTTASTGELKANPQTGRALLLAEARLMEQRAGELRQLADSLHAEAARARLVSLLTNSVEEAIPLFEAALLVASMDLPELDTAPYLKELESMRDAVRRRAAGLTNDAAKLELISKYLFAESGFHGSRTDYYNQANSYMNDVMDDREGLPITLAILYLELAEAAGARHVSGIPVPTHFMVKHAPPGGPERIVDVFDGGKVLTRSEAVELVTENVESISERDFEPASKRAIVVRMLRNLLGLAQRSNQAADALRYLDTIIAISPDSAADRIDRAQARLRLGDRKGAREDLQWLMEQDVPGVDSERLAEWLRTL